MSTTSRLDRTAELDLHIPHRWFAQHIWHPAVTAANLDFHARVHDLRHAHAIVEELLGHGNGRTTEKILPRAPRPRRHRAGRMASNEARTTAPARCWGGTLVQQVEQNLLQVSARLLLIETSGVPDFAGQRAFYVRLGYHEEARIRESYAPGDDKVVYWKLLQHAQPAFPSEQPRSV